VPTSAIPNPNTIPPKSAPAQGSKPGSSAMSAVGSTPAAIMNCVPASAEAKATANDRNRRVSPLASASSIAPKVQNLACRLVAPHKAPARMPRQHAAQGGTGSIMVARSSPSGVPAARTWSAVAA
jgi:hypothetical protein